MQKLLIKYLILTVLCLVSTVAQAQIMRPVTGTLQNAATATGNGTPMNVDGYSTVGVQVTISATATVTFEATQNLSTWQAAVCTLTSSTSGTLVTTATATGTYQCSVAGMVQFRARISAYTSGTVTVTATASPAVMGKKGGASSGSGNVATDTIWDAAGDLAYGTGSDTASRLAIGTANQLLRTNSGATAPEWTSTLLGLTSIDFGSNPGDAGRLRLSNGSGEGLCFEIATPGTDKCLILNTSDQLEFNGSINLTGASTGSLQVNGSTSGSLAITTAAATAQAITITGAAQTVGATTLTIPDMANVNDTFAFLAKSGTFTNKAIDCEGTGNVCTIPRRIWLPAAGCNNATAGSIWDLPTSNPAVAACVTGTNTQKGVLDFADGANTLSAQITYKLPSTWTGTVDANIKWLSATTTGSVVWQLATICVADAETDDPAFNTASTVTDAAKGTTNQTNDAAITTVTVTGCAAGELMHVKILRDPTNGSDDHAATARLIGVELVLREAI